MSASRSLVPLWCAVLLVLLIVGLTPQPAFAGDKIFNVKKYGAKGNGVDDDQLAIQAAFDAAARERATVFFPPGNYLHSDNLQARNIGIDGSQAILTATNVIAPSLFLNSNCNLRRLGFHTSQEIFQITPFYAAIVVRGNHITVRECTVTGTFQTGLGLIQSGDNTNHIQISKCNFSFAGSQSKCIIAQGGIQITISECNFTGRTDGSNNHGVEFGGCSQIRITRNNFTNNSRGVFFTPLFTGTPDTVQIDSNRFTGVLQHGVSLLGGKTVNNLTVSGNVFSGGPTNEGSALLNGGTLYRARFANNVISGFRDQGLALSGVSFGDQGLAIEVQASGNRISNCGANGIQALVGISTVISNNDIRNIGLAGIQVSTTRNFLTVEKNKLLDCGTFGALFNGSVVLIGNVGPNTGSVKVASDTYSGNTQGLQFFIRSYPPQTVLKGNTTTTTLPSLVGP